MRDGIKEFRGVHSARPSRHRLGMCAVSSPAGKAAVHHSAQICLFERGSDASWWCSDWCWPAAGPVVVGGVAADRVGDDPDVAEAAVWFGAGVAVVDGVEARDGRVAGDV